MQPGLLQGRFELDHPRLAGIDSREVLLELRRQRGKLVGLDLIFARRRSQGEESFLHRLQVARIVVGIAKRLPKRLLSPVERDEHAVERAKARLDQCGRLRGPAFQAAKRRLQRGHRGRLAGHAFQRIPQILADLCCLQHLRPPHRQSPLLASLGRQGDEFLVGMAQIVRIGGGFGDPIALLGVCGFCAPQGGKGIAHRPGLAFQHAERIEQRSMNGRIEERPVVMLSVDLDQRPADIAQHLRP